jgi:hypothetical protein
MVRWQVTRNGLPVTGARTREEAYSLRAMYALYYRNDKVVVQDLTKNALARRMYA